MKNRMLPFGYKIEDGAIVIQQEEAETVKSIFADYCGGSSLKTLLSALNERNIVFNENSAQWNKGRLYHILVDKRYIGERGYPQILDAQLFDKANSLKDSKRAEKRPISAEMEYLKGKIFCAKCGSKYVRTIKNKGKERWVCSNGCRLGECFSDEKIMSAILIIIRKVWGEPSLLIQPTADIGYQRTPEVMRLTNEIARMNEQNLPSFNTGKTLLFQLAACKFSACKEDKSVYTDYVLNQVENVAVCGVISVEFLQNVVHRILVKDKNEYAIEFINGSIITNKEEIVGVASEISNENRSESVTV